MSSVSDSVFLLLSVTVSVSGSVPGSVTASVSGFVSGFVSGSVSGFVSGFISGSVSGSVSGSLTVKCALAVPLDEAIPITCSPVDNFFIKSGLSVTIILPAFTV